MNIRNHLPLPARGGAWGVARNATASNCVLPKDISPAASEFAPPPAPSPHGEGERET